MTASTHHDYCNQLFWPRPRPFIFFCLCNVCCRLWSGWVGGRGARVSLVQPGYPPVGCGHYPCYHVLWLLLHPLDICRDFRFCSFFFVIIIIISARPVSRSLYMHIAVAALWVCRQMTLVNGKVDSMVVESVRSSSGWHKRSRYWFFLFFYFFFLLFKCFTVCHLSLEAVTFARGNDHQQHKISFWRTKEREREREREVIITASITHILAKLELRRQRSTELANSNLEPRTVLVWRRL